MSPTASSRWCPTPEQLMILEEMYRSGIRTPSASQIQKITSHLSFYGRIEGKNVFYWFQNHKARDRQKLRKKLSRQLQLEQQQQLYYYQMNQPSQQFLGYFESTAGSSARQQFPYEGSSRFLPQGGVAGASSTQAMNYTWKMDSPQSNIQMEKPMMSKYDPDWMKMAGKNPSFSSFSSFSSCSRPPQTLELFPITATNLREECTTSKQV